MALPNKVRLEGWLHKKKSGDKVSAFFKQDNQRWFRIQELGGSAGPEMALCYYNSKKDNEAKGWIYIKDITDVRDEKKCFVVVSAARTMSLEANSQAEHVLWLQTLLHCTTGGPPSAETSKTITDRKVMEEEKGRPKLANTEGNKSFSSNRAIRSLSNHSSDNNLHRTYGDQLLRSDYITASDDKDRRSTNHSRSGSMDEKPLSEPPPSSQQSTGGYPSRSAMNNREDHRLQYPPSSVGGGSETSGSSVSNRLHKYISGTAYTQQNNALDEMTLDDAPTKPNRAQELKRQQRRQEERERRSTFDSDSDSDRGGSGPRRRNNPQHSSRRNGDDDNDEEDANEHVIDDRHRDDDEEGSGDDEAHRQHHRSESKQSHADEGQGQAQAKDSAAPQRGNRMPPPPSSAPPRRARDILLELEAKRGSQQQSSGDFPEDEPPASAVAASRRSIDDVLFRRDRSHSETKSQDGTSHEPSNKDAKLVDSDEDANFDLKSELRRYHGEHENNSRPPRPSMAHPNSTSSNGGGAMGKGPLMLQPPTKSPVPPPSTQHPYTGFRLGTPPRPAGNPGTPADDHFATDDWDAENASPVAPKASKNLSSPKRNRQEMNNDHSQQSVSKLAGVQADRDWLDNDFDD